MDVSRPHRLAIRSNAVVFPAKCWISLLYSVALAALSAAGKPRNCASALHLVRDGLMLAENVSIPRTEQDNEFDKQSR